MSQDGWRTLDTADNAGNATGSILFPVSLYCIVFSSSGLSLEVGGTGN